MHSEDEDVFTVLFVFLKEDVLPSRASFASRHTWLPAFPNHALPCPAPIPRSPDLTYPAPISLFCFPEHPSPLSRPRKFLLLLETEVPLQKLQGGRGHSVVHRCRVPCT